MTERKNPRTTEDDKDNTWETEGGRTQRTQQDDDDNPTQQPKPRPDQPQTNPQQPYPAKKK